jgi:hypothetical protein
MSTARDQYLRKTYNITSEQYESMLESQHGACWICGWKPHTNSRRLAVDHDHKLLVVRGLLCYRCNKGLGVFRDNSVSLQRASEYLQQPWLERGYKVPGNRKRKRRKHTWKIRRRR